jgi:G3E family GTPase
MVMMNNRSTRHRVPTGRAGTLLPVVIVAGLHEQARRSAVQDLLAAHPDAVVLHHDLTRADEGTVRRTVTDAHGTAAASVDVALTNDCPCCAAREDLVPTLWRIARDGRYGLAVIELWGGSDPHPVAEVIAETEPADCRTAEHIEIAQVITAVDPLQVIHGLSIPDTLREHALHTAPDDETTLAEALAHQIEYAGVLAVPRAATESDEERRALETALAMLGQLQPAAPIAAIGTGELTAHALAGFDVAAARDRVNPAIALLPQNAEVSGVRTLVWERRAPLHPGRLYEALHRLVPAAHRSRGRFYLANRPDDMLAWDAAGANLTVEDCGPWLAALTDDEWDLYPPARRVAAALDWDPRHGDRVQRLAFTAPDLDGESITELLDSCLVTDEEPAAGAPDWRLLPDAFADLLPPLA